MLGRMADVLDGYAAIQMDQFVEMTKRSVEVHQRDIAVPLPGVE